MKSGGKAISAAAVSGWLAVVGGMAMAEEAASPTAPEATTAPAPAPTQVSARVDSVVELDEVQIVGKRLYEMRQDIIKAEDKFWAKYNELNTNDDYDVHCTIDVPTGTRFKYRVCRPVYYAKAQENEARSFITGEYAPPADLVAVEHAVDYEDTALAVINAHPELRKLVREREELERRYEETRKKRFKGKWILFE